MFQVGDKVVYGIHGACEVVSIEKQKVTMQISEYYVLKPLDHSDARFLIPTQNKAAVAKLQPLLSKKELSDLLREVSTEEISWIPEENIRKQRYKELIVSADRGSLIRMIHALHAHKQQQESEGKKFHLCDENFLRDAQKLLTSEFSVVLGIPAEEVSQFILNELNSKA